VTSSPALNEIRKFVGKMVGNLVASPKQFVRWYARGNAVSTDFEKSDRVGSASGGVP
jgi:hypothetical protein